MAPTPQSLAGAGPYRWADFLALDDDDRRELVDGYFTETDVPTLLHEWIISTLMLHLGNWARERRAGIVIGSGYKVKVTDRRGVMPDIQFFRAGRKLPDLALEQGAPDLAVEVVSPSSGRHDRVTKLNWYAAIGVPEYWIVDPSQQVLERLLLEPGKGYRVAGSGGGDDVFAPDTFQGLEIALAQLWTIPGQGEG